MSKDLWLAEHERIGEEYASAAIDRAEAERRLRSLGFDPPEIADQLDALADDRMSAIEARHDPRRDVDWFKRDLHTEKEGR